ncbi:MAG: hypothetical protein ACRDI2_09680 [Chloroflexota bacterium]
MSIAASEAVSHPLLKAGLHSLTQLLVLFGLIQIIDKSSHTHLISSYLRRYVEVGYLLLVWALLMGILLTSRVYRAADKNYRFIVKARETLDSRWDAVDVMYHNLIADQTQAGIRSATVADAPAEGTDGAGRQASH